MSRILIISTLESRYQNLQTVCTFIGDECVVQPIDQAEEFLRSASGIGAIILAGDEFQNAHSFVKLFPGLPFIVINDQHQLQQQLVNVVGELEEPVTYPILTRLLHRCQEYIKHKPGTESQLRDAKFQNLVGKSKEIQEIRRMIQQVAPTDANVLVLGESGTGKEVIASNVHYLSNRKSGPFIPVNCGAIPGELLESELFGHEKGAFTGAVSSRKGRFELAQGGTLFLDEIGDMPLQMQVKLLRVLQERTYERVGGTKPIECDVRIIAATHRNLESMISSGDFREDLYYRLNVFPIENPSLRERKEDIPLLLQEIISRFEVREGKSVKFTEEALNSLMEHKWAGNVRELSNLVERMVILCPNQVVNVQDLPPKYQHVEFAEYQPEYPDELLEREALNSLFGDFDDDSDDSSDVEEQFNVESSGSEGMALSIPEPGSITLPEEGMNLKDYLSNLEIDMITKALDQHDWVVARTAEFLGMRRTTLVEKMRKYNISK
ncbi:sigma-54-dependent Fis family transcriptional regulator [Paraneptunicella aestuarii]|uniref:sigma-54 dependent transcriptional regulator n=1 Tax=Paraneptunicella aestuarii TaxID=2831148 RepID=UPI001E376DD4|nr:sigma-54 dependent transcriptional regulator [Paraneptunicella aestuarii]UAA38172.1 sigma-54-dependent Fis family transcriptional regulator [Paraneptunicella aestuarii]